MVYLNQPKTFSPLFTVVSCIFLCNDETLILRRGEEKPQGGKWGMPGGKTEKDESLRTSMRREIAEETGLSIPFERIVKFKKFYVDSSDKQFNYILFSTKLNNKPKIILNNEEHTEYK